MSVVEESGDDVMLSDASLASPGHSLGSPIATKLINVGGDSDIFARFIRFPSKGVVNLAERPPQAKRTCNHQVCLQRCVHSQGPFRSSLPYDLKTGLLIRLSVTEGKRREEFSNECEEEAAWDRFCESTVLEGSILSKKRQSSLEQVLRELDRLVDDPEGELLLLGSLEDCDSDLDGDRDGADPSYFDQSYLGP